MQFVYLCVLGKWNGGMRYCDNVLKLFLQFFYQFLDIVSLYLIKAIPRCDFETKNFFLECEVQAQLQLCDLHEKLIFF